MALNPGTRLGPYEVTAQIGVGGMGEVYRATDTNLKRSVAIKVLPASVAGDTERLARFQREAEVLAALNHPSIAAIYGLERSGATTALVMELVEGPTLADRIALGAIPIGEALPIAKQIAEALEAAHEQGIIHRDLKPANIKVRLDSTVKVLDFGLAKAMEPAAGSSPSVSMSPTITTPAMTQAGMILGTAAYMSPEQARAKVVDKRSDIWAFGCVVYEMLTGRRAFPGEDVTDTLAAVVRAEPDWNLVPRDISPTLLAFLRRSLQKDPKQRVGDIRDMRLALEGAFETAVPQTAAPATSPAPGGRLVWLAFAAVLLAAAVLAIPAVRYLRETPPPSLLETRADINTPATTEPMSFALSPDGRQMVFESSGEGQSLLWLRPLGATSAQPLPGTEGATYPFWSPDSKSVAFFAEAKLKRIEIGGGRPQTIADAIAGRGGTWNQDGVILFAGNNTSALSRVAASGGEPVVQTKLNAPLHSSHRFPSFLPGGRRFLFYVDGSGDARGIYLGTLDSPDIKRLTPADFAGAYMPGSLLYLRQGALVAQRLDLSRGELAGDPVTIAEPVGFDRARNIGAFSASAAGVVAYRTIASPSRQLVWFDRSGKALGTMGAPDENLPTYPRLSPDGRRVAVHRTVQNNDDIWLLDGARTTRLTFDAAVESYAIWSRDGSRVAFSSTRKGAADIYVKPSSGAGSEELLLESPQDKYAGDFSPDGRFLSYVINDPKNQFDVWVLPLDGDRKPFVFLNTRFDERGLLFSPDGRWVAYQSNESGAWEIYVRPFPGPAGQWQVSTSGGSQAAWRADGKELFYVAPDGRLMAATIAAKGEAIEPGIPVALFQTRLASGTANIVPQYDVAPDGRFLMDITTEDSTNSPITLLLNWKPPAK